MTDGLHATDQWSGDVAAVRSELAVTPEQSPTWQDWPDPRVVEYGPSDRRNQNGEAPG